MNIFCLAVTDTFHKYSSSLNRTKVKVKPETVRHARAHKLLSKTGTLEMADVKTFTITCVAPA